MARVEWNKLAFKRRVKSTFEQVVDDRKFRNDVGKFLVDRIRNFAKSGKPLNRSRSFPSLKQSTIENRRRLAKFNKTDRSFRENKSNLTLTGQFWKSLKFNAEKVSLGRGFITFSWNIFFKGRRKGYRTGPNSTQKNPPSNEELVEFLEEKGFITFTKLDDLGKNRVIEMFKRTLRRVLSKQVRR